MLTVMILHWPVNLSSALHRNPNLPLATSRTSFSKLLPPWPQFMPHAGGRGYKELSFTLSNRKNLQSPQCSFWSQYVLALISSTGQYCSTHPYKLLVVFTCRDWKITVGFFWPVINADFVHLVTCKSDFDFTAKLSSGTSMGDTGGIQTPTQEPKSLPDTSFSRTPSKPKSEKDAYSQSHNLQIYL